MTGADLDQRGYVVRPGMSGQRGAELGEQRDGFITHGEVSAATLAWLRDGLTTIIGVEAIVALTDVGHRDREQTLESLEWTARALTAYALTSGTGR